jgi:hypothetical protein
MPCCGIAKRIMEHEEKARQEVTKIEQRAIHQAAWDVWFARRLWEELYKEGSLSPVNEAIGQCIGETGHKLRKDYEQKICALEAKLKSLELRASFEQKFFDLELRLDARQMARDEAKRGPQGPQGREG